MLIFRKISKKETKKPVKAEKKVNNNSSSLNDFDDLLDDIVVN